jgi:hypothetical protein
LLLKLKGVPLFLPKILRALDKKRIDSKQSHT